MSAQVQILGPAFSTFVRSVMLCCEEKGISYETKFEINGEPLTLNSEARQHYHPFGKIPALLHNDRTVFETASICRYIDATFDGPALQPEDSYGRTQVDQWSRAISQYVDQAIVRRYLLEFAFPTGPDGQIRLDKVAEAEPEVIDRLALLEKLIGDHAFICGDQYSYADAILTPMLDYLSGTPNAATLLPEDSPLSRYIQRMQARPSGQKVLNKQ